MSRIGRARRATTRRASGSGPAGDAGSIRTWARQNGYAVSDRGRISREARDAYDAAHPQPAA